MNADSVTFYSGIIVVQKVPFPRHPSWQADGMAATRIEAGGEKVKKRFMHAQGVSREQAAEKRQQMFGASAHGVEKPGWWLRGPKAPQGTSR